MEYRKLKGKIIEKFDTQADFARAVDEYPTTISGKLKGHIGITCADILKWSKVLDMELEEIGPYFFAN